MGNLVLKRKRLTQGESADKATVILHITEPCVMEVVIVDVQSDFARLAFRAPDCVHITRAELLAGRGS